MPRRDDDMPETCVRHEETMNRMESEQSSIAAANAADHAEIKEMLHAMDESIRGNGQPGIRTQISRLKLQVGVMWGLMITGMGTAITFIVRHFIKETP